MGNACWELYGLEHGIAPDGAIDDLEPCTPNNDSFESFYFQARINKYVPRAIFVDFDPSVIGKKTEINKKPAGNSQ